MVTVCFSLWLILSYDIDHFDAQNIIPIVISVMFKIFSLQIIKNNHEKCYFSFCNYSKFELKITWHLFQHQFLVISKLLLHIFRVNELRKQKFCVGYINAKFLYHTFGFTVSRKCFLPKF